MRGRAVAGTKPGSAHVPPILRQSRNRIVHCHVLYGIAQQESDWTHFCVPESPTSAVGKPERTIVSFDCGYGIAQVTSGMHDGDTPDFDQARVAADPLYNMIVGLQILRSKWEAVQCVGDREPEVVEDWYSALWAYNGLSYKNNPNNPTYSAGRGVYQPANGGSYPYQEKVLGWMEFPKSGRWGSIQPGYPNRGEIGTTGTPKALTEPKCGTPTSCTKTRTRNLSACTKPASPDVDAGSTVDAGPPAIVDAGIAVQLEAKGEADEGCSCRAAAAPARAGAATTRTGLAFLFFVLAAFGIRRGARSARRARSAPRSARR